MIRFALHPLCPEQITTKFEEVQKNEPDKKAI